MPVYLLSLHDTAQREQLVRLCYNLARLIPGVAVQPALRVEAGDDCLDSVMLQIGAVRLDSPEPAAQIEEVAAVEEVAKPEKPVEKKRQPFAPTGICKQCNKPGVLTKAGICKPCAMRNGHRAKHTPVESHPASIETRTSGPVVVVDDRIRDASFITRHGAIKGKKLG